jgi:hypothetical protein
MNIFAALSPQKGKNIQNGTEKKRKKVKYRMPEFK